MSNFNNFDIDKISSKLAQRWHLVSYFHCKKDLKLGSLDDAKNAKKKREKKKLKMPKDSFYWTTDIR